MKLNQQNQDGVYVLCKGNIIPVFMKGWRLAEIKRLFYSWQRKVTLLQNQKIL